MACPTECTFQRMLLYLLMKKQLNKRNALFVQKVMLPYEENAMVAITWKKFYTEVVAVRAGYLHNTATMLGFPIRKLNKSHDELTCIKITMECKGFFMCPFAIVKYQVPRPESWHCTEKQVSYQRLCSSEKGEGFPSSSPRNYISVY